MEKSSSPTQNRVQTADFQQREAGKMSSAYEAAQNFTTKDI